MRDDLIPEQSDLKLQLLNLEAELETATEGNKSSEAEDAELIED